MSLIALSLAAFAADPAVWFGDADAALAQIVAGSGRAPEAFAPTPWSALVAGPPRVVGDAQWLPCEGPPVSLPQWLLAVSGAESALGRGDRAAAVAEAAVADAGARCLGAAPSSGELARWHRVHAALGDPAAAAQAKALDPAAVWSAAWPTEHRAAYEAAAPPASVEVAWYAWGGEVVVDGAAPGPLAPGSHLVVAGTVRGVLVVREEPVQVLVLPLFPPTGEEVFTDPRRRADAGALFAAQFGPGTRVFVADPQESWVATAGRADWTPLRKVARSRWVPIGVATTVAGVGVGGAGAALAAAFASRASEAASQMSVATSQAAYDGAEADYDAAAAGNRAGWGLGIAGGVAALTGLGLTALGVSQGEVEVETAAVPGGVGLRLAVRR
jgi:hypothetical protein